MATFLAWCDAHSWVFDGIGVAALGWLGLLIFRRRAAKKARSQKQSVKGGTAYQAGRDIKIKK
ncbi:MULTISPECIES: hypothetical protein [Paraburkholderia]|uniref:Uncharacterized protein n=1 Tax=Paraburkholderia madseniana TaxID=2599607 RepID=A0AAP5BK76_9BURK|nr:MULTISPECIES: hypothetical protein [Paraburkholderia]MCX4150083.1 hypothetical protein [Paraburkholderia madseniana]MDN7153018.1 hypothetical protein [Paraburkholderia sp. WS6]MDQ6411900.1 hypothetical protein [Paraburkholderia madseniana]